MFSESMGTGGDNNSLKSYLLEKQNKQIKNLNISDVIN